MPIHHSCFNNPFEVKFQEVDWKNNFPYSHEYDDKFFQDDAVAEINDIFIQPNRILDRFQNSSGVHIGELGFGFGLNFFVTAKLWLESEHNKNGATLEYLSIEEALPSKAQILKVIKNFPDLKEVCDHFLEEYEPIHNDIQRINLPNLNLRLTLIQNQAELALKNLIGFSNNKIDAWYLDGFDPNKNQTMWSSTIFQYIGLLSNEDATFGTFTAAGFVKRGLNKFGFKVEKVKGFERKRHKLIGSMILPLSRGLFSQKKEKKIAVIGTGIAASSAAYAAARNGAKVDMFEFSDEIAAGASGNPVAAMYPRFSANNTPYSFLTAQSYFFAEKIYAQFSNVYIQSGLLFSHSNDYQAEWIEDMKKLKRDDIFTILNKSEMKKLYGLESSGLKVHQGGYLYPKLICKEMMSHQNIKIFHNHSFKSWERTDSRIGIQFQNQTQKNNYDDLVIANGPGLGKFVSGLKVSKGQLVGLKDTQAINLELPLNSAGYILPKVNGINWIGSTHEKEFKDLEISFAAGHDLIARTEKNFNIKLADSEEILMEARLRIGSRDRLPMAGCIDKNVYVLGALGTRGFSLAPILGDYIASLINHSPNPISSGIALAIDPLRFKD